MTSDANTLFHKSSISAINFSTMFSVASWQNVVIVLLIASILFAFL